MYANTYLWTMVLLKGTCANPWGIVMWDVVTPSAMRQQAVDIFKERETKG